MVQLVEDAQYEGSLVDYSEKLSFLYFHVHVHELGRRAHLFVIQGQVSCFEPQKRLD